MSSTVQPGKEGVASFRTKLFTAMMIIVATLTALGLYFAQRKIRADAGGDWQKNLQPELPSLDDVEEWGQAVLAELYRLLAAKPRIHAALEDNALDLLYPSAKDELRDLMEGEEPSQTGPSLYAKFYRFLDGAGAVLSPPNPRDVGPLGPEAETQLILKKLPETQQIGYIRENADDADEIVDEVGAVPIFSTETGDVISALVVGFKPFELIGKGAGLGTKRGIWLNGLWHFPPLPKLAQVALASEIPKPITNSPPWENNFTTTLN